MSERGLSELALAIAEWGTRIGAVNLNAHPGVWTGETDAMGSYGPLTVKVNAHDETNESIPPYTFVVQPKDNLLGFVAMVNPYGGTMLGASDPHLERRLIDHFNSLAQATP